MNWIHLAFAMDSAKWNERVVRVFSEFSCRFSSSVKNHTCHRITARMRFFVRIFDVTPQTTDRHMNLEHDIEIGMTFCPPEQRMCFAIWHWVCWECTLQPTNEQFWLYQFSDCWRTWYHLLVDAHTPNWIRNLSWIIIRYARKIQTKFVFLRNHYFVQRYSSYSTKP